MYWFAVTSASQKTSTAKLLVFFKRAKEEYGYYGFIINSLPQHQIIYCYDISWDQYMNEQNRSSGGVLKKRYNLGQNI